MLMDWIAEPWLLWLLGAVALLVVELLTTGSIFLFFAFGALVVSLLLLGLDLNLTLQVWIFLLTSVASLLILRKTLVGVFHGTEEESAFDDTPRGNATVVKEISPGIDGRVSFRGSFWPARAERHFPEGDNVMVNGYADGVKTILKVVTTDEGEQL
jgi:membrane protein implicated in regulation of membrane protease activity